MTINLTPELEQFIHEKVARGEFASAEALIEASVRQLGNIPPPAAPPPATEQSLENLRALFEEVDREPPPRETPLPDEAFDREDLYSGRA